MGALIEINTLVRLTDDIDLDNLHVGQNLKLDRDRERLIPLGIALLMVDNDWNFYGYCRVVSLTVKGGASSLNVEVLTIFSEPESKLYKDKFIEAGKLTGEVKYL